MVSEIPLDRQEEFDPNLKQRRLEGLLKRIPEEDPNCGLLSEISLALEGSRGSNMLTAHILREAARGIIRPDVIRLVDGEVLVIDSFFPKTLYDEGDGIFGERAMEIERRAVLSYTRIPQLDVDFLAKWEINFGEHYGVVFDPRGV